MELELLIAAARRLHQQQATPDDLARLQAVGLRPLAGGSAGAVYTFEQEGVTRCLKLYAVDDAGRAGREWAALTTLTAQGFPYHPPPVYYSPDPASPAIVMERLPGHHLGHRRLTRAQQGALHTLLTALWAIPPPPHDPALAPVYKDARYWLDRVQVAAMTIRPGAATGEAARLLQSWLDGPDPARLSDAAPAVFSNGDLNPSNLLWDGQTLRLVDFEFSGASDRAFDLADLVEHNQSQRTPAAVWLAFVARCDLSPAEQARFRRVRRLLTWTWLLRHWPDPGSPPTPAFLTQLARLRALLAD